MKFNPTSTKIVEVKFLSNFWGGGGSGRTSTKIEWGRNFDEARQIEINTLTYPRLSTSFDVEARQIYPLPTKLDELINFDEVHWS